LNATDINATLSVLSSNSTTADTIKWRFAKTNATTVEPNGTAISFAFTNWNSSSIATVQTDPLRQWFNVANTGNKFVVGLNTYGFNATWENATGTDVKSSNNTFNNNIGLMTMAQAKTNASGLTETGGWAIFRLTFVQNSTATVNTEWFGWESDNATDVTYWDENGDKVDAGFQLTNSSQYNLTIANGTVNLMENGFISKDQQFMLGQAQNNTANSTTLYVAVNWDKAVQEDNLDFMKNAAYKLSAVGTNSTASPLGVLEFAKTDSDGKVIEGHYTDFLVTGVEPGDASTTDTYTVTKADSGFLNSTIKEAGGTVDATFIGTLSKDKSVFVAKVTGEEVDQGLAFFFLGSTGQTEPVTEVNATSLGFSIANWDYNSSLVDTVTEINSTAVSRNDLTERYGKDDLDSHFKDEFEPILPQKTFNATLNKNGSIAVFGYGFRGVSSTRDIQLVKLTEDNSTKTFTYNPDPSEGIKDGDFWITGANGALTPSTIDLETGNTYYLFYAIEDDGPYDNADETAGYIEDPQVLGQATKGDGNGDSSGCMFNPAAGFGLEWLLLLLAPAFSMVVSRFRKQ
jgi:hypothetical protein